MLKYQKRKVETQNIVSYFFRWEAKSGTFSTVGAYKYVVVYHSMIDFGEPWTSWEKSNFEHSATLQAYKSMGVGCHEK